MSDPLDPLHPRPRPGGPLDPLDPLQPGRPGPFPRPTPWTPFGPGDNAQPDVQAILDHAAKITAELEAAQSKLTGMRDGPGPDDTPPVVREVSRADGQWPFLVIRGEPGDVGARPLAPNGTWPINLATGSSPDIIITTPGPAGEAAVADRETFPVTSARRVTELHPGFAYEAWVHVWNLGRSPATGVRVRAYLDPPNRFLGGRQVDLGDRLSPSAHLVVRAATFEAGQPGDNAISLLIAIAECISDPATGDRRKGMDRHVAHRMIYTSGI